MAYKLHNFLKQTPLKASQLNEMDEQIKRNADLTAEYNKDVMTKEIKKLSLSTDGQYVVLMYDGIALAEVPFGDLSTIIPCTELIVNDSPISLETGSTAVISASKQPSNSNQMIRYRSDDILIATVDAGGVITGINVGKTNINVGCGLFKKLVPVSVWGYVQPTVLYGFWSTDEADTNSYADKEKYWFGYSPNMGNSGIIFPTKDGDNLALKAGQTIHVESSPTIRIFGGSNRAHAYAPVDGSYFIYSMNWSGNEMVGNAKLVDIINVIDEQHLTYTATEDCCVNFEFSPYDSTDIRSIVPTIYDTSKQYWIKIRIE